MANHSSLIVSGQMIREDALAKLEIDINYFCKKLRIARAEFDGFMRAPSQHYTDFQNWDGRYRLIKKMQSAFERIRGKRINVYS